MSNAINCRLMAFYILVEVARQGRSFHPQVVGQRYPSVDSRNQAFTVHLCFGVLRYYFTLQTVLSHLLHKPLKAKDKDLELLMMIGLYQLFYSDTPQHAAINETVNAAQKVAPYAKGLVNAVLRNALREESTIKALLADGPSHPDWLQTLWQQNWPKDWQAIITANQNHPPFTLRVNLLKISRENYLAKLAHAKIEASPLLHSLAGINISEDVAIHDLPGFNEGLVSVQDGSAQLAASLLNLEKGQRVLDACAAPGGKTAHLLEQEPLLESVTAVEKDPSRITLLEKTLARLQLKAQVICADASDTQSWWDNKGFDRILLDAPCSATGVIRRHPDIKLHRQESDIKQLTKTQSELLSHLWPLLKPGGILLYATCSTLAVENVQQISHFLSTQDDAKELPIDATWGIAQPIGRQILPGQDGMDGFYYARLIKSA
ncbi:MAG: 16S rRNA (cytosine(967)-C(5))-methyltransferase RsmB [Candidatus Berkiella sp.]